MVTRFKVSLGHKGVPGGEASGVTVSKWHLLVPRFSPFKVEAKKGKSPFRVAHWFEW